MPRLTPKRLFNVFAAACALCTATSVKAQLTSHWSTPVSSDWNQASRWSTAPVAPTSSEDRAVLDAQGSPYVVTAQHLAVDRIEVASPDATLRIEGGVVSAANGIDVSAGKLDLVSGVIENTRISGNGVVAISGNTNSSAAFKNVTLATDASIAFPLTGSQRFQFEQSLRLEDAALSITNTSLQFTGSGNITGQGTVQFTANTDQYYRENYYVTGNWIIEPGVDLTFAGSSHHWLPSGQVIGRVVNRSNIVVEPDSDVHLFSSRASSYGSFRNEGTVTVGEGASLGMRIHTLPGEQGGIGNLIFGAHSNVWLGASGIFYIDQPINVPATARLELVGGWVNQSQINVASGGFLRLRNSWGSANWGDINVAGATIELGAAIPFSRLAQLETSSSTEFVGMYGEGKLDLEGRTVNLAAIPGVWNLQNFTVSSGTLTGLAHGGVIDDPIGLTLVDVRFAEETNLRAGWLNFTGASTIAAPIALSGGTLALRDAWKNESILSTTGGRLNLASWSTAPGTIAMTGGSLQVGFDQTFSQLAALPVGSPDEIEIGSAVDLRSATIDLSELPWELQLGVAGSAYGTLRDGVITASTNRTLRIEFGVLENVELRADVHTSGSASLRGASSTARNMTFSGAELSIYSTSGLLDNVIIDGKVGLSSSGFQIANGLTVNGALHLGTSRVKLAGDQTVDGVGKVTTNGFRSAHGGGLQVNQGTLTLGEQFTFQSQRRGSRLEATGGGIISHGTIAVARDSYAASYNDVAAPGLTIRADAFAQYGELSVVAGEELRVEVDDWTNDGVIRMNGGKLTLAGTTFRNGSDGEITGDGVIAAGAADFTNLGRVAPGTAIGTMTVDGEYAQHTEGQLAIELGGTMPGASHDLLAVHGAAELDGLLKVSLVDGFTPTAGSAYTFLTAQSIVGSFSAIDLPALPAHLIWETVYSETNVALRIVLPGDFTSDGLVDGADFLAWQRGVSPHPLAAADLDLWRQNYGDRAPATSAAAARVPEPTSVLPAALGGIALLAHRRPREQRMG